MLEGKAYTEAIDIWGLGVFLYELLHGDAPYGEETGMPEKVDYILKGKEIDFHPDLSDEVIDLIKSILKKNPEERLTIREIFSHPWMKKHEKVYNLNIKSFLWENSKQVIQTSQKSLRSIKSIVSQESQGSVFSTMSELPQYAIRRGRRNRRKLLARKVSKDVINLAKNEPGKQKNSPIFKFNLKCIKDLIFEIFVQFGFEAIEYKFFQGYLYFSVSFFSLLIFVLVFFEVNKTKKRTLIVSKKGDKAQKEEESGTPSSSGGSGMFNSFLRRLGCCVKRTEI